MRGQEIITKTDSLYFRRKIREEKFNASTNGSLKPTVFTWLDFSLFTTEGEKTLIYLCYEHEPTWITTRIPFL